MVTPYPDVNALLDRLLRDIQTVLGRRFAGLYLHGSMAQGGFDPLRSDIDFLVATTEPLPPAIQDGLAAMHTQIAAGDLAWASHCEGSYIPLGALRRYDPADCLHPVIRVDGSFGLNEHRSEWVLQRHILREAGIALAGPPPARLVDPISPADLRQAVRQLLQEWWRPQLDDPFRLHSSEYQAYAVLTMCRALFTLAHGQVVSKPEAAQWARQRLDASQAGLIERAQSWRRGLELDSLDETLALIRYTLACA